LVTPLRSNNPVWIAFHEYAALASDLWRARRPGQWVGLLFAPPRDHQPTTGPSATVRFAAE
jgi:hypothetical protein